MRALLIGLVLLVGCECGPEHVNANNLKPGFEQIRARHDAYTKAAVEAGTLEPARGASDLRGTEIMQAVFDEATKGEAK